MIEVLSGFLEWIPLLVMALGMAVAEGESDSADLDDYDDGGEPETQADPEPFLTINERQVYKTADDAKKALPELNAALERYRKFGKPEDLEAQRAKAEITDRLTGILSNGKGSDKTGIEAFLDTIPEKDRPAWKKHFEVTQGGLEALGFVRLEDVQKKAVEEVERAMAFKQFSNEAHAEGRKLMEGIGKRFGYSETQVDEMVHRLARASTNIEATDQQLQEASARADGKGYARRMVELFYGSASSEDGNQPRGADGKFQQRAEYAKTKSETAKLPKVGANGAPGAQGVAPHDLSTKEGRRAKLQEIFSAKE